MILVCGGAGYIGSHMVRSLVEKGHRVVVVDNLSTGHKESVHPDAIFYECDLRDRIQLDVVFKQNPIQAVVHFAAASLVGESIEDPLKYYDNNVNGTSALLECMKNNGVNRIVFSSTAAVYGMPKESPIVETFSTNPINPYGETKLAVEKMLRWADGAYGIKSVCLRYFNVAGAHPTGEIGEAHVQETHLIPLVLQVPLGKRSDIGIFGTDYETEDGTCVRDYIHVSDLIEAHELALAYLAEHGKSDIFNLGNGNGFSVNEVIKEARLITGNSIPTTVLERRAGDPDRLIASFDKARDLLKWNPHYASISKIIETAWLWHQKHPNGYKA